jgi:protein disulfide-isomerase
MIRHIVFFVLLFTAPGSIVTAQSEYKATQDGWLVSIDEAYQQSQETGKPIMANFTGSDWCGWCKKLAANVFVKGEFRQWAEENVILLELDFPRRTTIPNNIRQQNLSLQQAFDVKGFPTIWVFHIQRDEKNQYNINPLGRTGYSSSVDQFTSGVDEMIAKAEG